MIFFCRGPQGYHDRLKLREAIRAQRRPSKAELSAQLTEASRNTAILTDDAFHGGEPIPAPRSAE